MRIITVSSIIFLLSSFFIVSSVSDGIQQEKRVPRFISFDHKGGQIDVDLDLSIPFISIPLSIEENQPGDGPKSLVNINVKSLTIAALMAAITAFIVPLFAKSSDNQHNYRLNDEFGLPEAKQAINELILGNNYVTPCVQRAVCTAVMKTRKNQISTGTGKIIDGISNLAWFKDVTNGTAIEDAINVAHQSNAHCNHIFNGCKMPANIFQAVMSEFGIE